MIDISQKELNALLRYDQESGNLIWKPREACWFDTSSYAPDREAKRWNSRYANKPAMHSINSDGYRGGCLFGRSLRAHRVIWAMVTGLWPDQIDHIDHDRANNRWDNLREVSGRQNSKNRCLPANNTSGVVGVYWHERRQLWCAQTKTLGTNIFLGAFPSKEAAISARNDAEISMNFHPNHGKKRTHQKGTTP